MIFMSYTIINPRTMMIHFQYAFLADLSVMRPWRFGHFTFLTGIKVICGVWVSWTNIYGHYVVVNYVEGYINARTC